jgi:hypothetical protein
MLEAPQRMVPETIRRDGQALAPLTARVVGSAALVEGGRFALVPSAALDGARRVWLRNGLGHMTEATLHDTPPALRPFGVALLRLATPLDAGEAVLAPRDPFAGSPGAAIEYAASPDAAPAWPLLRAGFFGAFEGDGGLRKLGIELPSAPHALHGGPVFDAAGRLAGIALPSASGQGVMLPASLLRVAMPAAVPAPDRSAAPAARMPSDEVYERALRVALQVIALP